MVNRTSALITNYKTGSYKVDEKTALTFQEIRDLDIKPLNNGKAALDAAAIIQNPVVSGIVLYSPPSSDPLIVPV